MIPKVAIRATSKLLIIGLSISAMVLVTPQLAMGQPAGAPSREALRSLNLSRSQMRQLRGVMQNYQSSFNNILTSSQKQQLEDLQAEQGNQAGAGNPDDLINQLNLTEAQSSQLATLQENMAGELQGILTPEQLQQAQEIGFPGL
jgi:Spy/CpxP family protein refolding chaperone